MAQPHSLDLRIGKEIGMEIMTSTTYCSLLRVTSHLQQILAQIQTQTQFQRQPHSGLSLARTWAPQRTMTSMTLSLV